MGVIKSKQRGWDRIDEIMVFLQDRMPHVRSGYEQSFHVAIEGYSFGAIGNAVFQLAELGGILRYELWKQHIPYEDWAAMTWRKVIFGKGNFRKADEKDAFKEIWGLEGDLNALEAWAIARTSLMFHYENEWTKPQTEVFKNRMVELHG
jgi:Holliday junction resolvasome RuvABC endonuclease subunit